MDVATTAAGSGAPYGGAGGGFGGRRIDWTLRDVGIGLLWFFAILIVVPSIVVLPFAIAWGDESDEFYASALILSAVAEAGIALVAAAFTFRKYGGDWTRLGFGWIDWKTVGWAGAAVGAALAFGFGYGVLVEVLDWSALKSECDDQIPKQILNNNALMALAGVAVIGFAPVCEETFFRGFALTGLARRFGAAAGIVLSALIFSVAHVSPSIHKTLVPIFGIGLIFAFVYWRGGNLVSSILAHLAFNALSFTALAVGDCE